MSATALLTVLGIVAVCWILALIFLPGLGAILFLLHGRDRVRWPARRKRAAAAGQAGGLEFLQLRGEFGGQAVFSHSW